MWRVISCLFWFSFPWWITNTEVLFIYSLAIGMYFSEKCLLKSFVHLKNQMIWVVFFCYWVVGVPYIFYRWTSYCIFFAYSFSYSLKHFVVYCIICFLEFFSLMYSHLSVLDCSVCAFGIISNNLLQEPMSRNISSKSFIFFGQICKFLSVSKWIL